LKQALLILFLILESCSSSRPNLEDIASLCRKVGDKSYAMANDGTKSLANLILIQQGAEAECKLRYMTENKQ